MGNGKAIKAVSEGSDKRQAIGQRRRIGSAIGNVLYIPRMKLNLFCVGKASYIVITKKGKCELLKDDKVRGVAYRIDECYVTVLEQKENISLAADSLIT